MLPVRACERGKPLVSHVGVVSSTDKEQDPLVYSQGARIENIDRYVSADKNSAACTRSSKERLTKGVRRIPMHQMLSTMNN